MSGKHDIVKRISVAPGCDCIQATWAMARGRARDGDWAPRCDARRRRNDRAPCSKICRLFRRDSAPRAKQPNESAAIEFMAATLSRLARFGGPDAALNRSTVAKQRPASARRNMRSDYRDDAPAPRNRSSARKVRLNTQTVPISRERPKRREFFLKRDGEESEIRALSQARRFG